MNGRQIIQTGSWAGDQQVLQRMQADAAARGLAAYVTQLPQGGFQVDFGPGGAPGAMVAPQAQGASHCQACRRHAPTKNVTFHQNIGAVILRFPKTLRGNLCRTCIGKYFTEYTLISLFFGWWGMISFFYTAVTIPMNIVEYFGARSLPESFPGEPRR
jgi:hypothetical protein